MHPYNDFMRLWQGGLWDKVFAIIFIILILAVVGLMLQILWSLIKWLDYVGRPIKKGQGIIRGKAYDEPQTITTHMTVGNVMLPQVQEIPESWQIAVTFQGSSHWVDVTEKVYNKASKGIKATVHYANGRSGRLHVRYVTL